MKKIFPDFSKTLPLGVIALAFACSVSSSQALVLIDATTNDGGFESITGKNTFTATTSSASSIPFWGATLVNTAGAATLAPNNSGAEIGGNAVLPPSAAGSYYQPGGASTAFNLVTNYTVSAGDVFTVSWYAYATGAGAQQSLTLYTQAIANTPATYSYVPSATVATADGAVNPTFSITTGAYPVTPFTLTYIATAADAGKYIGLTIGNSGTAFMAADNFTLTVSPVPEPSALALALVSLFMAPVFLRRFHRAAV